jgi:hypothetical protein
MNQHPGNEPPIASTEVIYERIESVPATKSLDERKALLAQRLAQEVTTGARIESQTESMVVLIRGHRVNHILHFLLGFPTLGIWWITVWPALAIWGGEKRSLLTIDDYGNILLQKA